MYPFLQSLPISVYLCIQTKSYVLVANNVTCNRYMRVKTNEPSANQTGRGLSSCNWLWAQCKSPNLSLFKFVYVQFLLPFIVKYVVPIYYIYYVRFLNQFSRVLAILTCKIEVLTYNITDRFMQQFQRLLCSSSTCTRSA